MRFLITGAAGFAGTYLGDHLKGLGHEVVAWDMVCPGGVEVDVCDREAVLAQAEVARPDGIFHLAAIAFVPTAAANPEAVMRVNVEGTKHILEAAGLVGARTLFVSSGTIYGPLPEGVECADEGMPANPCDPYSVSKARAEEACAEAAQSQEVVCVRAFNHTGPGQSPDFVCSDFARQVARCESGGGDATIRVGDLRAERDFCDVRDMVGAYRLAWEKGRLGEVYNACSGRAVIVSSILDTLVSMSDLNLKVEVEEKRLRGGKASRLVGSYDKLRDISGWEPTIALESTLADLLAYWRESEAA